MSEPYSADGLKAFAKLWLRRRYPDALIVEEFSLAEYGGALIDVAAIRSDHIVGVEIKGEGDSPARLALQGMMYSRICREIWLLTAPSLAKRCRNKLPPGWGVIETGWAEICHIAHDESSNETAVGRPYRETPETNGLGLSAGALAAMPWTREYPAFANAIQCGSLPRRKQDFIVGCAARFPTPDIEKAVCTTLHSRSWWPKVVDRPKAEKPPVADFGAPLLANLGKGS